MSVGNIGDVNRDGVADLVTGAGPGGGPHVRIFDGLSGRPIGEFFAYSTDFRGGVNVTSGQVTGFTRTDVIVTGAGPGGGPHVKFFSAPSLAEFASFFAFDPTFRGGVFVGGGV